MAPGTSCGGSALVIFCIQCKQTWLILQQRFCSCRPNNTTHLGTRSRLPMLFMRQSVARESGLRLASLPMRMRVWIYTCNLGKVAKDGGLHCQPVLRKLGSIPPPTADRSMGLPSPTDGFVLRRVLTARSPDRCAPGNERMVPWSRYQCRLVARQARRALAASSSVVLLPRVGCWGCSVWRQCGCCACTTYARRRTWSCTSISPPYDIMRRHRTPAGQSGTTLTTAQRPTSSLQKRRPKGARPHPGRYCERMGETTPGTVRQSKLGGMSAQSTPTALALGRRAHLPAPTRCTRCIRGNLVPGKPARRWMVPPHRAWQGRATVLLILLILAVIPRSASSVLCASCVLVLLFSQTLGVLICDVLLCTGCHRHCGEAHSGRACRPKQCRRLRLHR